MLAALGLAGGLSLTGGPGGILRATAATRADVAGSMPSASAAAEEIKTEFLHAWNGYKQFAWGHDEVHPLSGTYSEFFVPGQPIGLSIIEALDTLYVMELDQELAAGVQWIEGNLSFDIDGDFHVFEAIIRVVGGLLAGYLATGSHSLLALTVDITDRLMPAFAKSPTGMPYQYVNLRTGEVSGNTPPLAEIGTNILEFGLLSRLTGDRKYYDAAKTAYRAAIAKRSSINLMATSLNVETGQWADTTDQAPNPPSDSFYEYLWGGWALLGDRQCRDWFVMLNDALTTYASETYDGNVWYKQVDFQTGALVGRNQSELASFYAEVLGHAGDLPLGAAYYRSWTAVLDKFPVLPEEIDYTTITATSKGNQFRPEYANASFDLYFQTMDPYYASTAYQYFQGMKANARTANGYTVLDDVTTTPMQQGDLFPAYGFAENFKYLYLIFGGSPRFNSKNFYLSTEGKILRGLLPAR
ncbi:glycoside hydrolase family 47 protein [Streptomyces sp. RB6PN25]|uniref:Glycoside hydrolase family 47 protein n=2 Tax=Streptomyces humicola TaxID=2953240 RepID=A0ABT1PQ45_9ACTN|nr:glycoside hydrolase family 47 protein [Streptomyces humicola]